MRGLDIPHVQMGNVSSADLFEQREQELFDLYERHQLQYRLVADMGANIGVHTCVMAKLGWNVLAFEPDPVHFAVLEQNVARNGVQDRTWLHPLALAPRAGMVDFVRVLGNTTASHIGGARSFHGPVERFPVKAVAAWPYFARCDFVKIDVEGSEAGILCSAPPSRSCEYLVEIGSEENARRIYEHFKGRRLWKQGSQEWAEIARPEDMPTHYRHGSLFIGEQP